MVDMHQKGRYVPVLTAKLKEGVIIVRRLNKRIPINFAQCRPYRQGGKLLLLLAGFVTLSFILSVVGTGEMLGNLPVLFAQVEDPTTVGWLAGGWPFLWAAGA
jgi:hypothetical protein